MARVAPVNLPYNVKTLWFDPGDIEVRSADYVVVQTARGVEMGMAASDIMEVDDQAIQGLKSPLRPVIRIATEEDMERCKEMEQKSSDAMPIFKKLARETNEGMHPVSVEYLLDGDKAVFYFEAEERIDFRDLVRKLANEFHVRIDLRQIGVRDEARIVGGIAHCGQVVCCKRLGGEFKPVSIRMAKDQDLSLNPQSISGLCGRLMCCLRYENDTYKSFNARAPKIGAAVDTPDGEGKVVERNVPRDEVSIKVGDEKPVSMPVSGFIEAHKGERPKKVDSRAWEEAKEEASAAIWDNTLSLFHISSFSGEDKLGSAKAVHHGEGSLGRGKASGGIGRSGKERGNRASGDLPGDAKTPARRRRRHVAGASQPGKGASAKDSKERQSRPSADSGKKDKAKRQPRRRSTTIKADGSQKQTVNDAAPEPRAQSQLGSANQPGPRKSKDKNHRPSRGADSRSSKRGTGKGQGKTSQAMQPAKQDRQRIRPGYKSSGLARGNQAGRSDGSSLRRRRSRKDQ